MTENTTMTRTESLLALLVLHNMAEASQVDKAVALSRIGFSNPEIATLLQTTPNTIKTSLSVAKRRKATKKSAKKTAKKAGGK